MKAKPTTTIVPREYAKEQALEELVLWLLNYYPERWSFDGYHAYYTVDGVVILKIWIANANYADLTLGNIRLGGWWKRRQIRAAMLKAKRHSIVEEVLTNGGR